MTKRGARRNLDAMWGRMSCTSASARVWVECKEGPGAQGGK